MTKENKGRLMGVKFKTFSGAAKRAQFERDFDEKGYRFEVVAETDRYNQANGFGWRILKTKKAK